MPKHLDISIASVVLAIALGLSACSLVCPPPGLEEAAYPSIKPNDGFFIFDVWRKNPGAEAFLRDRLQTEGLASLTTKHGMQCVPQASADCADCSVCSSTFPGKTLGASGIAFACVDYGQMFVRAEIGPGTRVIAMTYWRTPEKKDSRE
jgi:hypothetical protein